MDMIGGAKILSERIRARQPARQKIAGHDEAVKVRNDLWAFGCAFVDADGYRIDPLTVVTRGDHAETLVGGVPVYPLHIPRQK